MFEKTLYPKTKQVLEEIQSETFLSKFYLAGGTSLALQIGHRKSSDLDWFTDNFPKMQILLQNLRKYETTVTQTAPGTLDTLINSTKVSFLEYTYPLLEKLTPYNNITLCSVIDIACMKITAISSRGSKKDFVDLYAILNQYTLAEIFAAFEEKYKGAEYNKMHILKSLVYFTDAETDPEPDYIKPIQWNEVKERLIEETRKFTENIVGK